VSPTGCGVADILRSPPCKGPLWLACVRDACSRRIVGWKASDRTDAELLLDALEYAALWSRDIQRDRLVFHADHGAAGPSSVRPVHA
jgi:putative transposase